MTRTGRPLTIRQHSWREDHKHSHPLPSMAPDVCVLSLLVNPTLIKSPFNKCLLSRFIGKPPIHRLPTTLATDDFVSGVTSEVGELPHSEAFLLPARPHRLL